jgi:hypothetical protein
MYLVVKSARGFVVEVKNLVENPEFSIEPCSVCPIITISELWMIKLLREQRLMATTKKPAAKKAAPAAKKPAAKKAPVAKKAAPAKKPVAKKAPAKKAAKK